MYKSLRFLAILLISIFPLLSKAQTPDANNILYVNINVSGGTSTGNSWANAIPQLGDALKWARTQNNFTSGNPLKIYVAKGTYKPMYNAASNALTSAADRDNAFVMVSNVQIYGGFAGTETVLAQRNWAMNTTTLSGDIGTVGTNTDNTYHVVVSSGAVGAAKLDGFTVTGGYTINSGSVTVNSNAIYRGNGGGMYNVYSSTVVANCSFTNNGAVYGGGMFNFTDAAPTVTNCSFTGNSATNYGGGMYNQNTLSTLTVSGCTFSGNNVSGYGGGMANNICSPIITNCSFTGSTTTTYGGGMYNQSSSPIITNCSFTGNTITTSFGSAMYNASSSPAITNSSFTGNTGASPGYAIYDNSSSSLTLTNVTIANNGGNGIFSQSSTIAMQNSIVWEAINGTYTPKYSLIKGSTSTSDGNIKAVTYGTADIFTDYSGGDYTLKSNSPAVNAGSNALFTGLNASTLDLANNPRVYNYNQNGVIDLGAFEYQNTLPDIDNILYVNTYVSGGTGRGNSWTNAIPQLADALKFARINNNYTTANPLKIYVAKGIYKPLYNATDGNYTTDGNRNNAFVMVNNVQIYGGFDPANNIDDLTDTRIFGSGGSILSGNLGAANDVSDNAYHLVIASGNMGNALLDGFTIADAYANGGTNTTVGGNSLSDNHGAGIYNFSSVAVYKNLVVKNNGVEWDGAGMINDGASPVVSNVLFAGNYTKYKGTIINSNNSSPVLTNVTITGNSSDYYSGIYNSGSTSYIYNSIIWDNKVSGSSTVADADIFNDGTGHATIKNSITQSYTTGNAADNNLVGTDPLFTNYAGGDYTLKVTSPAINKGSNDLFTGLNASTLDLAGNKRLISAVIDMGAYENQTLVISPDANNIIYVNAAADGTGNGSSWANAIPQLADVLKWARAKSNFTSANPLKIYVAKGTYKPLYNATNNALTSSTDRDNAFVMVNNVQIYGGFDPATGIDDLTDTRIFGSGGTILSGDIGTVGTATDNTYHIVVSSGAVGNALLDGFTVTGGYSISTDNGSITVNGNVLYRVDGGGMYNHTSSPAITNCSFTTNTTYGGGGMFNWYSSPSITNCIFTGNSVGYSGGAMYNSSSSPTITNCSFAGNSATYGGSGMYNSSSSPKLTNTTIANNVGTGFFTNGTGTPVLQNTIIWDAVSGNYTATYSLIKGTNPSGTGNINATSLAVTDIFTNYSGGNYTLKSYSQAINKGDNALFTGLDANTKDILANPRVYKYTDGGIIDIGAYEYQSTDITPDANNILYVNTAVSGGLSDGSSWANAIPQLADALKWARTKNNFTAANPLKIYVAKGTYQPMYNAADGQYTTNGNRNNAFVMIKNVQLYGGFDPANDIKTLGDARILPSSAGAGGGSILSGDIGTIDVSTDNTYHVVISSGEVGNAKLDGFTVTGGYSTSADIGSVTVNYNSINIGFGGGMLNYSSLPAIANCSFTKNTAALYGGGMYNITSSPAITNSSFVENKATSGGGMYSITSSSPAVANCSFTKNTATTSGGGMYNNSSSSPVVVTNSSFVENTATKGGGMFNNGPSSSSAVINSRFIGNVAVSGGAIYSGATSPVFTNVTIANNGSGGVGFYNVGSASLLLQNTIIWDAVTGSYTAKYSLIKDNTDTDNGNINATLYTTTDIFTNYSGGDYTLKSYSPAINKGSNALFTGLSASTLDFEGNPRVYKYADGGIIDMGAYEYQSTDIAPDANNILYVNTAVSGGLSDGSSWANAITELADALKWARTKNNFTSANPLKIYVAKGTYKPMYNAADGQYTTDGGRNNAFVMVDNVLLYGGFDPANGVTDLTKTRIFGDNGSVLSGDLGTMNNNSDNAYHVVVAVVNTTSVTTLDGFKITGGNANNIYNSITVNNSTFSQNCGGGIYHYSPLSSTLTLTNVLVSGNTATGGGGIYAMGYSNIKVTLMNSSVSRNTATNAGGIYAFSLTSASTVALTNSSVNGNTATNGSGITVDISAASSSSSTVTLLGSTLAGNTGNSAVHYMGSGLKNFAAYNSVMFGNAALFNSVSIAKNIRYSLVQGESSTANGNLDGTSSAYTTTNLFTNAATGDYSLLAYSPVINKGSNTLYTNNGGNLTTDKDLAGNARVYKYADGGIIDMGAYEYQSTDITPDANNILYVNTAVSGGLSDGSSWTNAIPELADALKWARAKNNFTTANPLKIYVAKGTYKPLYNAADASYTTDGGRDNAFVMVKNVQIYGGFAGTETEFSQRNWTVNTTTLSGDIGTVGTATDNTYHVVISSGSSVETAKLDGFTVTGGYSASADNGTIVVNNVGITRRNGGGMYNTTFYSPPTVTNCNFTGNSAGANGGGIYNTASPSSPLVITNCSFAANTANVGGGMCNSSSSPVIVNCSFTANTASNVGGGIFNSSSSPDIINTTIANNGSNGFYNSSSISVLQNTIIWDTVVGSYTANYSLIKGANPTGTGNINATNLAATDIFTNYSGDDYTLKNGSTAIAKGDNTLFTGLVASTLDLAGNARVYNYITGGTIDLGAYEYQGLLSPTLAGFSNITKTYGNAAFVLTAPTSNSNGAINYTSNDTNVATVNGNTVSITGAGTATITATQAATADYDTGSINLALTVDKANATLSNFVNITKIYGDGDFTLTAPTSNSNGAISYASNNSSVAAINGNTVSITGSGTATITATQAATADYNGGSIDLTLTVSKATPTLSGFANINKTYGDVAFTLTAPASNSNGAISYTSNNSSVAAINGNTVSITGSGTATITATQAATADYNGGSIDLMLIVGKAGQLITFAPLTTQTTTSPDFALSASTNSNLPLSYTSSNTTVAEVYQDGLIWKVHIKGEGATDITASQVGNSNYMAAVNVVQQLQVVGAPLPVILVSYSAKPEGNYAKLEWKTTNEQNNKGFELYRKTESTENSTFVKIGEVPAPHISNLTSQIYSFTDKTPLNGTNYYKLVQIDNDGKATELGIRTVTFNFQPSTFNLYPNPTADQVNISFTTGHFNLLQVVDVNGKVLQQWSINAMEDSKILSLGQYPAGIYIIHLNGKGISETRKVVKR